MKYRAIKVREVDHQAVAELAALVRQVGIRVLPRSAQEALADGVTAGSLVAAGIAVLHEHAASRGKKRA